MVRRPHPRKVRSPGSDSSFSRIGQKFRRRIEPNRRRNPREFRLSGHRIPRNSPTPRRLATVCNSSTRPNSAQRNHRTAVERSRRLSSCGAGARNRGPEQLSRLPHPAGTGSSTQRSGDSSQKRSRAISRGARLFRRRIRFS